MKQRVWIGADHAGYALKNHLVQFLKSHTALLFETHDLGTHSLESVDYPDFANLVAETLAVQLPEDAPKDFGILVCGSGQGMAMRANKFPHIRAALCWNLETAKLAREHNNANILCLSGRMTEPALAEQMVQIFLSTPFLGGRHQARVTKIAAPVKLIFK